MEANQGIERIASPHDFVATAQKMESILRARGLTIFGKIDFSGDAERAGLMMAPTQMLIFGNPKSGTPMMVVAPTSALDLPLKVLISQDSDGKTWLSYNTPEYLAQRHSIPPELRQNIAGIRALVQAAVA